MRRRALHRRSAPLFALLALLAAILLPGLHAHDHAGSCPAPHDLADCSHSPADHDHRAPDAPHDEHNCPICELILLASPSISPDPAPVPNLIAPVLIAASPLSAQCPCAIAHPRSLPARGPPIV